MAKNKKEQPLRAKIVGLWGDPGLTEYYNADFLSRFLIVQMAPYNEIPCQKDSSSIIKLVLRPRTLWIDIVGTQRKDYWGNRNTQVRTGNLPAAGVNAAVYDGKENIQPISSSYKVGDEITINRLPEPLCHQMSVVSPMSLLADKNRQYDGRDIFSSNEVFTAVTSMSVAYRNASGDAGVAAALVYSYVQAFGSIVGPSLASLAIVMNAGSTAAGYSQASYGAAFQKLLTSSGKYTQFLSYSGTTTSTLTRITGTTLPGIKLVQDRGGLFRRFLFSSVEYIDANVDNRSRQQDAGCLPLIVASPSTFPTPISRNLGGVNITL